ncbi:2-keto-3-deoxygluconate permease [Halomonas sp. AOP43-A1-21]
MRILDTIEKVPGGLMVIPLLLGAFVNTFAPGILEIGGFTQALFRDGAMAVIGVFLVCMGAQLPIKATGAVAEKGGAIMLGKLFAGVIIGLSVGFLIPGGMLLGLTPLAIIAAMTNSNGGLFLALTTEFGNKTDRGSIAVIAINDGPFLTLVVLGAAGLAQIPLLAVVAVITPILIGFVLGNLDLKLRSFLKQGEQLLIPFFAFPLGTGIDFRTLIEAGSSGVLLGALVVTISGGCAMLFLWVVQVLRRRPPKQRNLISGIAESSTAGNAVATPAVVAAADPAYQAIMEVATAQIAGAVVTTAILPPLLTVLVHRWQLRRGIDPLNEYDDPELNGTPAVIEQQS